MIWFTSDQHFGHKKIVEYCNRPFKDADDMAEQIIERYNDVVLVGDIVYHLGDFSFVSISKYLSRLNGYKILVPGNHDACHPCHSGWIHERARYVRAGFAEVHTQIELDQMNLCHLPYRYDTISRNRPNGEERYVEHRPKDDGRWLLHGHVHELWQVREKMINVGVDQWDFRPVNLDMISRLTGEDHGK